MNASSPAFAQSQDGSKDTGVERAAEKFAPSRIDLGLASHRSGPAIADDEMLSRRLSASHPAQVVFADEEALKSADKAPGALRPNAASFLGFVFEAQHGFVLFGRLARIFSHRSTDEHPIRWPLGKYRRLHPSSGGQGGNS